MRSEAENSEAGGSEVRWQPQGDPRVFSEPPGRWERLALIAFVVITHGLVIALAIMRAVTARG